MIVSIHQPAYMPWLGYLDRIAKSDAFVFLDTVQFEKNSFTNRNRIKTPQGPGWLTLPVLSRGHIGRSLTELRIDPGRHWRRDHLRAIAMNYARARGFGTVFPTIERWFEGDEDRLCEICHGQLLEWLAHAGIGTRVVRASTLGIGSRKSQLVLDICRALGADIYLSGPLGRDYLNEAEFRDAGIEVTYHGFTAFEYPQLWGDFVPNLSALDYWMNSGELSSIFAAWAKKPAGRHDG